MAKPILEQSPENNLLKEIRTSENAILYIAQELKKILGNELGSDKINYTIDKNGIAFELTKENAALLTSAAEGQVTIFNLANPNVNLELKKPEYHRNASNHPTAKGLAVIRLEATRLLERSDISRV